MLHTQYVFVYGDICILVINFAPPKVKSRLRHCLEHIRTTTMSRPYAVPGLPAGHSAPICNSAPYNLGSNNNGPMTVCRTTMGPTIMGL